MAASADQAAKSNSVDVKLKAAAAAEADLIRMLRSELSSFMSQKRSDIPDNDDDAVVLLSQSHPDLHTPEVLARRWRREHKELVPMFRRDDEEIEARRVEIVREHGEKGYMEADEVDEAYVDVINEWGRVQRERPTSSTERLSRMRITADEDRDEAFRDFLRRLAEE